MKRASIIAIVLLLLLGAAVGFLTVAQRPAPLPVGSIVLPDGSWVHIEAVTYGTNHLVGPPLSLVALRMPLPLRILMNRTLGRRATLRYSATTESPKLVVWLNRGVARAFPTNLGSLKCVLSDTNGLTCGDLVPYNARYPLEVQEFAVFPRREREIVLTIYHQDTNGTVVSRGSLNFANPAAGRYSRWEPEALPAKRRVADLQVTLERLVTGLDGRVNPADVAAGAGIEFTTNRLNGTNLTLCKLRVEPTTPRQEEFWVASVETIDATGNQIRAIPQWQDPENGWVLFSPALWASEPAWKLRFELMRAAESNPELQFIFRDIRVGPLGAVSQVGWMTNCGGVTVMLDQVSWREMPKIRLIAVGLTNGLRLDLLSARTDAGVELATHNLRQQATNWTCQLDPLPGKTMSVDLKFAVRRGYGVEFVAKPESGPLRLGKAN